MSAGITRSGARSWECFVKTPEYGSYLYFGHRDGFRAQRLASISARMASATHGKCVVSNARKANRRIHDAPSLAVLPGSTQDNSLVSQRAHRKNGGHNDTPHQVTQRSTLSTPVRLGVAPNVSVSLFPRLKTLEFSELPTRCLPNNNLNHDSSFPRAHTPLRPLHSLFPFRDGPQPPPKETLSRRTPT